MPNDPERELTAEGPGEYDSEDATAHTMRALLLELDQVNAREDPFA